MPGADEGGSLRDRDSAGGRSASSRRGYLVFVALSLIVFAPALGIGFRDDDFAFLAHVREHGGSGSLLGRSDAFTFHRPGATALFYLEYVLFGLHPGAYLAFNYGLHLGISLVLRSLFLAQGAPPRLADTASGLFLVGYAHYGKQVMWACTSGPLASVLLAGMALRAVLWVEGDRALGSWRRRLAWTAILAALWVGPSLHESSLVAPLLILLLARRRKTRAVVLALALVAAAMWIAPRWAIAGANEASRPTWPRLFHAPIYLLRYVGFMLVPFQPRALASLWGEHGALLRVVSSVAHGAIGAAAFALMAARRGRASEPVRFACLWLPLALLPFCLVGIPEGWMELRYTYFAAAPLSLAVAAALLALPRVVGRSILAGLIVASALLVVGLGLKYRRDAKEPRNTNRLRDLQALSIRPQPVVHAVPAPATQSPRDPERDRGGFARGASPAMAGRPLVGSWLSASRSWGSAAPTRP
ncbi:MAG: hypothetical protein OEO21_07880 [Candidatus Krumholzibacteria bacterium]|nr:hypothetical protein [Candidatus Krumholzibacteria bacterium]